MKSSSVLLAAGAAALAITLSACDGLKEAMTAHVDTVARAGSQELTVDRLAALLNEAKVPPRKDVATAIANAWLDYQLLGQAAANGDTAISTKDIDKAMWSAIASYKARKYYETVSATWGTPDPVLARKMYEDGEALAAQHILILTKGKPESAKPAALAKAKALQAKATSANFAELAAANSEDPGSAKQGGKLGIFRKGQMVPPFEQGLLAIKPGQISQVVETDFGYHIIRRQSFEEVQAEMLQASQQGSKQKAESAFVVNLQKSGKLEVRSDAANTTRTVLADPDAHIDDGSTIATSSAGKFTAGRLAQWLLSFPPGQLAQTRQQLGTLPDSIVTNFVKQFATNELVLKAADSAKIGPSVQEFADMRTGFIGARDATWMQLRVDPKSLADSGKSKSDREKIAGARVERFIDELVAGKAQFVEVPQPLSRMLRDKAEAALNPAGLDRALERAVKSRAAADSTKRASQPASAVPIPEPGAAPEAAPAPAPAGH